MLEVCKICGKARGYHQAGTAKCPGGKKSRVHGYSYFLDTMFIVKEKQPKSVIEKLKGFRI